VPARDSRYGLLAPQCRHVHADEVIDTFEGRQIVRRAPDQKNAHNDCQDWRPATFFSDLDSNPFKFMMVLFAVLLAMVGLWRMCMP
jgi:hypothetical protein